MKKELLLSAAALASALLAANAACANETGQEPVSQPTPITVDSDGDVSVDEAFNDMKKVIEHPPVIGYMMGSY